MTPINRSRIVIFLMGYLLPQELQKYIIEISNLLWENERIRAANLVRSYYYRFTAMKIAAVYLSARLPYLLVYNQNIFTRISHEGAADDLLGAFFDSETEIIIDPFNRYNVLVLEFISKYITRHDDYYYWCSILTKYKKGLLHNEITYNSIKYNNISPTDIQYIKTYERCLHAFNIFQHKIIHYDRYI